MADGAPLMLSVSGLRGIVGTSFTPEVATRFGAAVAGWLADGGRPQPTVVLGRDSRPSGPMISEAVSAGLLGAGANVVDVGLVTTPGLGVMVEHLEADAGVMVTASHNPAPWNGLKVIRHDASSPPLEEAAALMQRFETLETQAIPGADADLCEQISRRDDAVAIHVQKVLEQVDVEKIRAAGLRVVVDSVHGAGGPSADVLLAELNVQRVHLALEPSGDFQHPPEPTREHLTGLCEAMIKHKADVG
ncbi:MAG: hypothetical protein R3336_09625, partial [Phycisphaeraceae bacterium]|nr:hypothetical protein [Phycisphaeraceae bacterium]